MKKLATCSLTVMIIAALSACGGNQPEPETADGPMEETGESIDEAAEDVEEGAEEAVDETGDEMEEAGDSIEEGTDDMD